MPTTKLYKKAKHKAADIHFTSLTLILSSRIKDLSLGLGSVQPTQIDIAAGVTTGAVASGVIEGKAYRGFNAIGQNVLRSAQMYELMKPGVLFIDEKTYSVIHPLQREFQKSPRTLGSDSTPCALYYQNLHTQ